MMTKTPTPTYVYLTYIGRRTSHYKVSRRALMRNARLMLDVDCHYAPEPPRHYYDMI